MTPARRKRAIALLVVTHLVLFAGLVVSNGLVGANQSWTQQAVPGAVLLSEMGLLSVWAGLGRGRSFPRLGVVALLGFAVVCIPQVSKTGVAGRTTFGGLLLLGSFAVLVMMLPIVLSLAVVRSLGWRLVRFSKAPPAGAPLQFSVWHLLALTAVAAAFLSAGYYVRPLATFEQHALFSPAGTSA